MAFKTIRRRRVSQRYAKPATTSYAQPKPQSSRTCTTAKKVTSIYEYPVRKLLELQLMAGVDHNAADIIHLIEMGRVYESLDLRSYAKDAVVDAFTRIGAVVVAEARYPGGVQVIIYNPYKKWFDVFNFCPGPHCHKLNNIVIAEGEPDLGKLMYGARAVERLLKSGLVIERWHPGPNFRQHYLNDREFAEKIRESIENLLRNARDAVKLLQDLEQRYRQGIIDDKYYKESKRLYQQYFEALTKMIQMIYKILREDRIPRDRIPHYDVMPERLLYVTKGEPRPDDVLDACGKIKAC